MSETPRTEKARKNAWHQTSFYESSKDGALKREFEAWKHSEILETELAAMTAERDALKELDAIAKSIEWCMRLSKSVKEGETMVQWVKRMIDATASAESLSDTETKLRSVIEMNINTIDFLQKQKELAERQVAGLCGHIDDYGSCCNCPAKVLGAACSHSGESCREQLATWSRAEAERGKG